MTRNGRLIAAADDALAWTPPDCTDCGIFLRRGDTISVVKAVPNVDPTVPGAFSTRRSVPRCRDHRAHGPEAAQGAIVHSVAVVDLDKAHLFGRARRTSRSDIRSTTPVAMTWSSGGARSVRDTSDRIVAYEPRAGGIARMFAFRPRERPPPSDADPSHTETCRPQRPSPPTMPPTADPAG